MLVWVWRVWVWRGFDAGRLRGAKMQRRKKQRWSSCGSRAFATILR